MNINIEIKFTENFIIKYNDTEYNMDNFYKFLERLFNDLMGCFGISNCSIKLNENLDFYCNGSKLVTMKFKNKFGTKDELCEYLSSFIYMIKEMLRAKNIMICLYNDNCVKVL